MWSKQCVAKDHCLHRMSTHTRTQDGSTRVRAADDIDLTLERTQSQCTLVICTHHSRCPEWVASRIYFCRDMLHRLLDYHASAPQHLALRVSLRPSFAVRPCNSTVSRWDGRMLSPIGTMIPPIDHPPSVVVYNFQGVCRTITFENHDVGSSFLLIRYISKRYGSSLYMKIIGSRSRSQEQKK